MNEDFSHERLLQNIYKHLLEEDIDNIFEDKEWWRRVRPRDKKAFRTLIGDIPAAKRMRHVKKGGAFHLDPPKYKGIKDHPGMGLLEEQEKSDLDKLLALVDQAQFGDSLEFTVLQNFDPPGFGEYCADETYTAKVLANGNIEMQGSGTCTMSALSKAAKPFTKIQVKNDLAAALSGKELCQYIDCKASTGTMVGQTKTFAELLATPAVVPPTPDPTPPAPEPTPDTAEVSPHGQTGNICDDPANEGKRVPSLPGYAPMVCKAGVATAIGDIPLRKETKENVVQRTAKDELKGASPQEINAVTKFFMDQPEIKSVGDIFKWFSWLLGKIWDSFIEWGAELLGIKQIGTKAVELATGAVTMVLTGGASAAVAQGGGKTAVLFGDSQMGGGIGKAWKDYVTDKGWQVCSGCKLGAHGTIGQWVRSRELQKILEKEKPTLVVIALGGWAGSWYRAAELIEKIKEWSGNEKVKIIWSGAPPIVKGYARYSKQLFDSRKKHNDTIKEKLKPHSDTVTFVDPYDYVLDFYTKAPPGDGLHMPESAAKKYVSKVTDGWSRVVNRHDSGVIGKIGQVGYGRYHGRRAIFLPNEIRAGKGSRSWKNNNPGNIRLTRSWKNWGAIGYEKQGGPKDPGHAVFATYEDGLNALKKYIRKYRKNRTFMQFAEKIYAPANWAGWGRNVAKWSGAGPDDLMESYDVDKIARAVQRQEGFWPGKVFPRNIQMQKAKREKEAVGDAMATAAWGGA